MAHHTVRSSECQDITRAACVIDQDNLCHRGFDKASGRPVPQAQLDVFGFARALRRRGVVRGTICRNRDFTALADQLWQQLGFQVVAARSNCDPQAIISLILFAEAGFRHLILAAGDGDYTHAVKMIRRCGVRVEIWSRQHKSSRELLRVADGVRYIDEFFSVPLRPAA